MGIPTMMAGSMRNILLGAIEVKREEYQKGKSAETIKQELKADGFSEHNINRILIEVQNKPIPEDFPPNIIKDSYNIKENLVKLILKEDLGLKVQDVVRFKGRDYVVQQVNKFGSETELLIKFYG
ncbi:MAG TPA: hypothetical protein PLM75_04150 [bacterium]|nr:hypothetical protein [bacterium]HPP87038.1 hypothetical protein [bacterium]